MGDLNTPSFTGSIQKMIDAALASAHIGMPARVESYDASQQRISAKPIIRRSVKDEAGARVAESLPIIEGIPVIFPGAGVYKITWPLAKGDIVWLMFGEGSLDKWLSLGGSDVDPNDDRRNALSDAVAIAGILPFSHASDQTDPNAMVLAGDLKLGSKDATEFLALKSDVAALKSVFDVHTHLDPASGSTGTASAAGFTFPSPTGTTKVKAK